ncbi:hypothetical protein BD324DRAFT_650315 [Kockovaella imperatae]|uniref:DUF3074 domain-containing protein n=1 Tax=Kockovaella imperatae TaxID=4999 RepID=A0A1Y1UJQ5_9TREE|nr:hypothetical protein BD324DRAFT_650315 [Kockovaella imperatae]ORX37767.1 hypothetical protein BD324DRAFT_650315 [Kockovaella imperatae]
MTAHLDLKPLTLNDIPDPESPEFAQFVDSYFAAGTKLADTIKSWTPHSSKKGVELSSLKSSNDQIRKALNISEFWCARTSYHTSESMKAMASGGKRIEEPNKGSNVNHGQTSAGTSVREVYERFRSGLFENHSEHERQYIEACQEAECLQVFKPQVAEVWRLTYSTPPPSSPRTFVALLLCRELDSTPGQRSFMNISVPFSHPSCVEKQGPEKSRARGRYVSVERVIELEQGGKVEWRMATSSDAGGNIPQFITNASLPSQIAIDVPSFIKWAMERFPDEAVTTTQANASA